MDSISAFAPSFDPRVDPSGRGGADSGSRPSSAPPGEIAASAGDLATSWLAQAGDRVTLFQPSGGTGGPTTGNALADFFRSQSRSGTAAGAVRGQSAPPTPPGALRSLFAPLHADSASAVSNLMDRLEERLGEIDGMDPEQAKRLRLLMGLLAALDPEHSDQILQGFSDSLDAWKSLRGVDLQESSQAAVAAASQASADGDAPSQAARIVQVSLDIEVTVSSQATAAVAQLREQGVEVRAIQTTSTQTMKIHIEFTGVQAASGKSDPLVLDLAGNGVDLSGVADGADFDINGDGRTDRTAFVRGDDAFLVLDRNGNGRIDSGKELFGDQNGAANGFQELARYDLNLDGRIDRRDAVFDSLRLLHDKNGDGVVAADEWSTLAEAGIESLSLDYATPGREQTDRNGNGLAQRAEYTAAGGRRGTLVDAWLGYA